MTVYSIPDKLNGKWDNNVKAMIDEWLSFRVSLDEFKKAVLVDGVNYAKSKGAVAWIVDSSKANGVFTQEIQAFIGSDVFPAFAKIGIKYFITITSEVSAMTKMSVNSFSAKVGPNGLKLLEVNNLDDAINWLKSNA